jgi:hypothetical protein
MIGLRLLPDVDTPTGNGEHQALVLQDPDGPGYHVLAHVIGLLECPAGRERTIAPLARGYPAAEDAGQLLVGRGRASMINTHSCKVRQGKTDLTLGYTYLVLPCPVVVCLGSVTRWLPTFGKMPN